MRRSTFLRIAIAAAAAAVACGGSDAPTGNNTNTTTNTNVVTSVVISPSSVPALAVGGTVTLTAAAKNSLGQDITAASTITWSSADANVASVSNGVVTAKAAGSAAITASASGVSASVTITVTAATPTPRLTTISVSLASSSLAVGASTQGTATPLDQTGNPITTGGLTFTWASANTGVATVSATGLVTAVAAGTTTISATNGAVTGNATLTVNAVQTGSETLAALPLVTVNTTPPPAPDVGGQIIKVSTSAQLTAALTAVVPGDVIELANGVTYVGNFTLFNRLGGNGKWVTIRPQTTAGLPAPGQRMTPAIAAAVQLPVIQSPTNGGAFTTALAAHHYRLIGLEITVTPGNTGNTGLVRFGDGGGGGQTTLALTAHDLVVDRCFIHGTPTQNVRRAIGLNSATSAIIDSYISEIHEAGADAQAIAGWNGPGPYKIENNYLEASSETVSFGGTDPDAQGMIPSDIEIRHNHFYKPAAWKGKWLVKNLFETKSAQRVLVEGNLMENNWIDGQGGSAINLKSTNQSGGCPWCSSMDITMRYNLIRNTGAGFNLSASPDAFPVTNVLQRITIYDNVIANVDVGPTFNGDGRGFLINQNAIDMTIMHNTIINPTNAAVTFGGPNTAPPIRLTIRDNIMGGGSTGVKAGGIASGTATITIFMALSRFVNNVIILGSATGYPSGSFYPTAVSGIGFINASALGSPTIVPDDLGLSASSTYKGKASDGKDPGANVAAVAAAIQGVIVP